ncbi:MAG TPA: hypothetical protein VF091_08910 [Gaiellaceae bacterium]
MLSIGALGLAGVVAFVALPLLRSAPVEPAATAPGATRERLERRDRALTALRELEFDHRTGKISDEDYTALLGPLRTEAAEALQAVPKGAAA